MVLHVDVLSLGIAVDLVDVGLIVAYMQWYSYMQLVLIPIKSHSSCCPSLSNIIHALCKNV